MPHFHIPLQSGNDKQLREMRRRYRRESYICRPGGYHQKLMPHACIGCDVITGFPGETEADFLESYEFIKELDVSYLHVFTYSESQYTAAEMSGKVPVEERRRRNQALRGLSDMKRRAFYSQHVGTERPVLFEHHRNLELLSGVYRQLHQNWGAGFPINVEIKPFTCLSWVSMEKALRLLNLPCKLAHRSRVTSPERHSSSPPGFRIWSDIQTSEVAGNPFTVRPSHCGVIIKSDYPAIPDF